uniref:Designed facilitated dissociation target LHD101An1: LHD101A with an N-terminal extension n=1 Tax=synthetic construct TaxID=32630 RepID=UPI003F8D8FD7
MSGEEAVRRRFEELLREALAFRERTGGRRETLEHAVRLARELAEFAASHPEFNRQEAVLLAIELMVRAMGVTMETHRSGNEVKVVIKGLNIDEQRALYRAVRETSKIMGVETEIEVEGDTVTIVVREGSG